MSAARLWTRWAPDQAFVLWLLLPLVLQLVPGGLMARLVLQHP